MEVLYLANPDQLQHFFLILIRVSVILFLFPFFGSNSFPVLVKAGLSLALSLALYSVVKTSSALIYDQPLIVLILIASEFFIGLVIALVVRLFFGAAQMAGLIIGFQMGFSMINVMDPQSGSQVSIMEQLAYWVVLSVFILLGGHYIFISALVESFELLPQGSFVFSKLFFNQIMSMTTKMFITGVKISAPVMVALLFVSVAFGITAKFAPQMNVLIISFPVKIAIGLVFFGACFEVLLRFTRVFVNDFPGILHFILRMFSGS